MSKNRSDDVNFFIEGCDWTLNGLNLRENEEVETKNEEETIEESEDYIEPGFYEVEGDLVFVNEDQELFEVFQDTDENVFVYNEEYGLFQTFEDEEGLVFEELDSEAFEVLEEEVEEEDNEDN